MLLRNLSPSLLIISGLYLFRWVIYAGLFFVVINEIKENNFDKYLIFAGVVTAIFGLVQYIFIPDTRFLSKYGWDDHYFRVSLQGADRNERCLAALAGILGEKG